MNVQEIIYANEVVKYRSHLWRLWTEVMLDDYLQPSSREDLDNTLRGVYDQLSELSKRLCDTLQS